MSPALRRSLPLCLALSALWATPPQADTIDLANNLTNTADASDPIDQSTWSSQSFTTDATHTTLTSVSAKLANFNSATGNMGLYIYSSTVGNKPDSPVATIGTYDVASVLTNSYTNFTAASLNVSLTSSTQYFLVIKGVSLSTTIDWGYTNTSFPFTS